MTALLVAALVAAERPQPFLRMPHSSNEPIPKRLSETGAFQDVHKLIPTAGLIPYEINVSFWSDGANKRRWLALPSGAKIEFSATDEWRFPPGTVFVKHFSMGDRRIETRLLVRSIEGGVYGVSYRWRDDGSDADLVTAPLRSVLNLENWKQPWYFPSPDDCRKCHVLQVGVLGLNTRQLNRNGPAGRNQLEEWSRNGWLSTSITADKLAKLPRLSPIHDPLAPIKERARSYFDVNCGFCHRPSGAAADFDARFETPFDRRFLIDAPARINLGIDHARQIASNDPWRSMVLVRMQMLGQTGMPPLAHESIDKDGVALLRRWVESMPGEPTLPPPAITPRSGDFAEPVCVTISHPDRAAEIRYTLDGRAPTLKSPVYREPIQLTVSKTLRARAFRQGFVDSIVSTETYIITPSRSATHDRPLSGNASSGR